MQDKSEPKGLSNLRSPYTAKLKMFRLKAAIKGQYTRLSWTLSDTQGAIYLGTEIQNKSGPDGVFKGHYPDKLKGTGNVKIQFQASLKVKGVYKNNM